MVVLRYPRGKEERRLARFCASDSSSEEVRAFASVKTV